MAAYEAAVGDTGLVLWPKPDAVVAEKAGLAQRAAAALADSSSHKQGVCA